MRRLKPALTILVVTGALVGGGAAIANAASSSSSTTTSSSGTGTTTTRTAPSQGSHAPSGRAGSGSHNCPNM